MQHRARDLLMRHRTQLINAMRAHVAELGITAPQGREGIKQLVAIIANDEDGRLPVDARASLIVLAAQLEAMQTMIGSIERRIVARHRSSPDSRRLQTIPGVGVIGATAIAATVTDPAAFRSGARFCDLHWAGPATRFDWGKAETGADLQAGGPVLAADPGCRRSFYVAQCQAQSGEISVGHSLLARRPFKVVAIALANKRARVAWALLAKGGTYRLDLRRRE
jgi:transposase